MRPRVKRTRVDPGAQAFADAWQLVRQHPLFAPMTTRTSLLRTGDRPWASVETSGRLRAHRTRVAETDEWAWVFAHCLLHLGFAVVECREVVEFQAAVKVGRRPDSWDELGCLDVTPPGPNPPQWTDLFAAGLSGAAVAAVDVAGGARRHLADRRPTRSVWDLALSWFVSSYPLLGALASGMKVVADADLARGWDISIAAVDASLGEIYVNPLVRLTPAEWRFVLAHEMLHAALRHADRTDGRDPYLWNVAADFVVNGWLVEMGVGVAPDGVLHDPDLAGLSVESVYDRITTDLRRYRKLATLRGRGSDLLGDPARVPRHTADLDDFYRRALLTGLSYHTTERGLLPTGLVEEIRALEQPPLDWDARLARWFEEHVPSVERRRTYARASRRQSATPHIPRPGWVRPEEVERRATFGVVLDTSGSMDPKLLGKALGAIASYALSRDVPAARVVFCDAVAYDAGYVRVEDIAGRVRVRGRGGTVLQPGVDLLERADDFPADGPVLVITDGQCDYVRVRREHAFLVPKGARLPFRPRGPVFRMS
ncbi:hypothetical protein A6A25_13950 [Saccharothrix sp. CB00851]|nr:hypothetical protein A6A25_13950 [Saccharothrix sp. CB00851]